MIAQGSIEIVRGTGKSAVSEGRPFGVADRFDEADAAGSIKRIAGATIGAAEAHTYPPASCLGVWSGTDSAGRAATITVWIFDE